MDDEMQRFALMPIVDEIKATISGEVQGKVDSYSATFSKGGKLSSFRIAFRDEA